MASMARYKTEHDEKWRDFVNSVPFISLPAGYEFAVIPPFGGAAARFLARKVGATQDRVSVYLDRDCSLGYMTDENDKPIPYWEIYPVEGDTHRCYLNETDELVRVVVEACDALASENTP